MSRKIIVERLDPAMVRVLRQKTGAQRLKAASNMARMGRQLVTGSVRQQHPDWNNAQVHEEATRRILRGAR